MNLDLQLLQYFQRFAEDGVTFVTVAYDPTTVEGSPEDVATAAGWIECYREATATLVEVIYTDVALAPD